MVAYARRRAIAASVVDAGLGLVGMGERRMSLEEIFLALVGDRASSRGES